MNANKFSLTSNQSENNIKESFDLILSSIKKRKKYIIVTVLFSVIIAALYSFLADPVYESTIILKKEKSNNQGGYRDEFERRFSVYSSDLLDTEMEIVRTRSVLLKVIDKLNLQIKIDEISYANGQLTSIDNLLPAFNYYIEENPLQSNLPVFSSITITNEFIEGKFHIIKTHHNKFTLFNADDEALGASQKDISLPFIQFSLVWPNAAVGDKFSFLITRKELTLNALVENIRVSREGLTSLFRVSARAGSPRMAQLLTGTLTDKYRETRLEQKRQTIHYSFDFIDEQVKDISKNLKESEIKLSEYKSEHKIALLDESSRDIIQSLSSLESEKVRTELELSDHQNRLRQLSSQVKRKGYFDQTYLTPRETSETRTPFAVLLEQLSDIELQRLQLLQRRKENHPDIITVNEQIQKIKDKLADYNQNTLTSYRIIINTLRKKRANLEQMITEYSSKMESMPAVEAGLAELMREKNIHEKMYNLLMDKREELRVAEYSEIQDIVIIDPPTYPIYPISPKKKLNVIIGFLAGIIIAIVFTLILDFFEKRVMNIEDVKKNIKAPLLTIIPQFNTDINRKLSKALNSDQFLDRFVINLGDDTIKEAFRVLRTKLNNLAEKDNNVLLITSCEENSGKTSISSNLALSLTRAHKKVLLVDADLRKSGVARMFKIPDNFPGLYDYITKDIEIPILWKPDHKFNNGDNSKLHVMPAGAIIEEASEVLDSHRFQQLLDYAKYRYDYVLVDTPPITKVSDTLVLSQFIKKVLLVIRYKLTIKDSIPFTIEQTEQFELKILGWIMNSLNPEFASNYYKYGYGYGYGYGKAKNVS